MRSLPPLVTRDRAFSAVLIVGCGIVQAIALAVAAFATRDAFAALHAREVMVVKTTLELGLAGATAAVCLFLSRRQAESLGQSFAIALRHTLYKQIASLPKSRHDQLRTGALSLRFVGDLSAARLWFGRGLPDVLTAMIVLPGAVAILVSLDTGLALSALAPLGLSMVFMALVAWRLEQRHQRLRKRRASIAISMIERIAIAPELDRMGRTGKELQSLDAQGAALRTDAVARRGRTAGLQAILRAGVAVAGLAILWRASHELTTPETVAASLSVLALVAMPLQDLAAVWDRYCAWSVARQKAQRLLGEPTLTRDARRAEKPVTVSLTGTAHVNADAGAVTRLTGPHAEKHAHVIAGLDHDPSLHVEFGDHTSPHIVFVGDTHIGLQGSLRRTVTLSPHKRPDDETISQTLSTVGLAGLLDAPRGLEQRIAENGKGLTASQTLRLDLARAVLVQADLIVISSLRWEAEPEKVALLKILQDMSPATIILVEGLKQPDPLRVSKAT